jgi:hypothetical protein
MVNLRIRPFPISVFRVAACCACCCYLYSCEHFHDLGTMGPTQQFQQQVIQKYGWRANFDTDDDGYWFVDVVVGLNSSRYHFQSTSKDPKKGKEVVSSSALKTLAESIAIEEAKPVHELKQVFKDQIRIYDSRDAETWPMFWKNKPKVVGIDAEGNQKSPPVLVQISTDEYTILEVPKRGLSSNLQRLLNDDGIIKVFCDNFSNRDKKCLGLHVSKESDFTKAPIIDLEVLFGSISGTVKVPRGLSKIVTMCMPELNVRIIKPPQSKSKMKNIGRFAMIEQGKAPSIHSLRELSKKEKQYAALDSWCTLQAYRRIQEIIDTSASNVDADDEASIKVVTAATANEAATSTTDLEILKSDPDALAELVRTNLSLTYQLKEKEKQLEEAHQRIEALQSQPFESTAFEDSWNGPGSDDDTIHPIGSTRRESKRNKKRKSKKQGDADNADIIGSILALDTADQPKANHLST